MNYLTACVSCFVGCVDGVPCVCALVVAILHIETFVTFDFGRSQAYLKTD